MGCNSCTKKLCSIYLDCTNLGTISTPFTNSTPSPREYTVKYSFLDSVFTEKATILPGEKVEFKDLPLNESYCYRFEVYDWNNTPLKDGDFDSFEACTKKEYTI